MLNHEPLRLADGEYRFACLVWDNEPLPSGQSRWPPRGWAGKKARPTPF